MNTPRVCAHVESHESYHYPQGVANVCGDCIVPINATRATKRNHSHGKFNKFISNVSRIFVKDSASPETIKLLVDAPLH